MPSNMECLCCQEVEKVHRDLERVATQTRTDIVGCITAHPGFDAGCLNPWVLEMAWHNYWLIHYLGLNPPINDIFTQAGL